MTAFFERTIESLQNGLVSGPLLRWMESYPRLAAWIVLATGMVILLVIEARKVGLLVGQWAALIIATVLVAGACIWIVSWEDDDEEETEQQES